MYETYTAQMTILASSQEVAFLACSPLYLLIIAHSYLSSRKHTQRDYWLLPPPLRSIILYSFIL